MPALFIDGEEYTFSPDRRNIIGSSGREIPIIDTTLFDTSMRGTEEQSRREFAAILTEYIRNMFEGKVFVIKSNGKSICFNRRSAKEFAGSKSSFRKSNERMAEKAGLAARLQTIIENAIFVSHDVNEKMQVPHKARRIDNYNVEMAYLKDEKYVIYEADMLIALHEDGADYFYDIVNCEAKKKSNPPLSSLDDEDTNIGRPFSKLTIPQSERHDNRSALKTILPLEPDFPECLRTIRQPPSALYVRGRLPDPSKPAVAIIGARNCTSYGADMARWFAAELSKAGAQIISGMALGVDGIAQRAALDAGGSSFALLGCGTDICYPKTNRDLYDALLERGGVISEYPDGTQPLPAYFPQRNRLIAGFSQAVLVVEAREKSGTLITADAALEQGKDVFVLPGRITDALSAGCNRLLAQGAGIALSPQTILEALPIAPEKMRRTAGRPSATSKSVLKYLSDDELSIWKKLGSRPLTLQELYDKVAESGGKYTLPNVLAIVMTLVEKSVIRTDDDGRYYI